MPRYSHRLPRKHRPLSAEFMYLLVVLAAGAATAWWAGQQGAMNLSIIQTVAATLGLTEHLGTTRQVGYSLVHTPSSAAAAPTAPAPAPYCQQGQTPAFANGMAELEHQLGNAMGAPTECEHPASDSGDTIQETTTGLAAYNSRTNTETFTDGWHHWALTSNGLVTWDGTQSEPPAGDTPVDSSEADPDSTQ